MKRVWVFNGNNNEFPSAIFSSREMAEEWIGKHSLNGTLTSYPVDISVYDWAVSHEYFVPKKETHSSPYFMQNFSSGYQEHAHYEDGRSG